MPPRQVGDVLGVQSRRSGKLAVYIGWLLNGTAGGLIADILFVLPGFSVVFLASPAASWITGQTLRVNGGNR